MQPSFDVDITDHSSIGTDARARAEETLGVECTELNPVHKTLQTNATLPMASSTHPFQAVLFNRIAEQLRAPRAITTEKR